jgi:hypothetical protein
MHERPPSRKLFSHPTVGHDYDIAKESNTDARLLTKDDKSAQPLVRKLCSRPHRKYRCRCVMKQKPRPVLCLFVQRQHVYSCNSNLRGNQYPAALLFALFVPRFLMTRWRRLYYTR